MSTLTDTLSTPNQLDRKAMVWLLLAGLILVSWLFILPGHVLAVGEDWQVSQATAALPGDISEPVFTAYVLGLQLLGAALFLLASLAIFRRVILPGKSPQTPAFWTGLFFLLVPLVLYLNAGENGADLPGWWEQVKRLLIDFSWIAALGGYLGLFFLLPYGAWRPRWSGWLAVLFTAGLVAVISIMLFGSALGDLAWGLFMGTFLFGMLAGLLVQIVRYRKYFTLQQKRQSRWITTALALNPLLLAGILLQDTAVSGLDWIPLLVLHLQLVLPLLIPLAVLHALARRSLWDASPAPRPSRSYLLPGLLIFLLLATAGFAIQFQARASAPNPAQPWTLATGEQPRPLIVDSDLGNDDVLALLFLMQHPGVELQAITVVGTGLAHCEPGVRNTHGLLELAGYADIPVSCGGEEPLDAEHAFPASWRTATDRLWGLGLPLNDRQPDPRPAPELLAELLASQEQPIPVLALGPLTNLAEVFSAHPEVIGKIERLYYIGGAVEVPGNVYDESLGLDNRTAEWNVYADPLATRQVFESGVPITLIPLDATNHVPVSMPLFRLLQSHHPTRPATFTFNIFYINQGWIQTGFYYLWDTLASAVFTNPEVAEYREYKLQVITERGPDYGRLLDSPAGAAVTVATSPDRQRFEELFLRVINTK